MRFAALLLGIFTYSLAAQTSNQLPLVRIVEPSEVLILYSLTNSVIVRVEATDTDGSIREVRLIENGQIVATDLQAPHDFVYEAQSFGRHVIEVQAVDNQGGISAAVRTIEYVRIHDDFPAAVTTSLGTNLTFYANTVEATRQKGEPNHAGNAGGKSVWWAWRPTVTGTVTIDTFGSDFDSVLGVYTNSIFQFAMISNLVAVASSDDDLPNAPLSKVKFMAIAHQTYYIAVDGRDGFAGNAVVNLRQTRGRAPVNDLIATALPLGAFSVSMISTNVGATKEIGEPDHTGNPGGASLWWRINGTPNAPIRISTAGSNFDTLLAVYTNASYNPRSPISPGDMAGLRLVVSNDDGPGSTNRTSQVEFTPQPGVTYWVAVDGYDGAEGTIRLSLNAQQPYLPPLNDRFVSAIRLTGSSVLTNAITATATLEAGEPQPFGQKLMGKTVWYRWTAPSSGTVHVSTKWSSFDTLLAVYTGTNINALTLVESNDDDGGIVTSALTFNAISGVEYRIAIGGYANAGGNLVLTLNQPALLPPRMVTQFVGRSLAVTFEGLTGTSVMEATTDFQTWVVVRTISTDDATLEIEPTIGSSQRFYRIRQLE